MSYGVLLRALGYPLQSEDVELTENMQNLFTTDEEVSDVADLVTSARSESEKKETLTTLRDATTECSTLDQMDPLYLNERQRILHSYCQGKLAEWKETRGSF